MSPIRNQQPAVNLDPLAGQGFNLLKQSWQVNHHPIPNNTHGILIKDTRWYQVQRILCALVIIYSMAGIGAALQDIMLRVSQMLFMTAMIKLYHIISSKKGVSKMYGCIKSLLANLSSCNNFVLLS